MALRIRKSRNDRKVRSENKKQDVIGKLEKYFRNVLQVQPGVCGGGVGFFCGDGGSFVRRTFGPNGI